LRKEEGGTENILANIINRMNSMLFQEVSSYDCKNIIASQVPLQTPKKLNILTYYCS